MSAVTQQLADYVSGLRYAELPPAVAERGRWLITDTVGIALRARHESPAVDSLLAGLQRLGLAAAANAGHDGGSARVIGDARPYSAAAAALINGALAHALDFDDTHAAGSIHPSAPIVPAALAAAELSRASGQDFIGAVVAGYETQIRLSLALVAKDHYARGFHPSATCGAFGAAAAAGRLLGLSASAMSSAFGIALSQSAGSMQFLHDGAWTKLFQVGYAAMNGLIAATLAAEGFKGPGAAFEGRNGFLRGYAPNAQPERVIQGLGSVFETLNIALKPYPSCRYTHAALDALIELKQRYALDAEQIDGVEIGLPQTGIAIVGAPLAAKQAPNNVVDGQFSMPFTAAVALRSGRLSWDDYPAHLNDPITQALCRRIDVVNDPQAEAAFPANMSGSARVRLHDGRRVEKFVQIPRGEPDNFMTESELRDKFYSLTGPYLGRSRRQRLADALLDLQHAPAATDPFALTLPDKDDGSGYGSAVATDAAALAE